MATDYRISTGAPAPLGATFDGSGVNFALFSAHADKVELCLFDSSGEREVARLVLPGRTGDVWHGALPDAEVGQLYGYRVHGPYDPHRGHRFNPNKLLVDPYAKALHGSLQWTDEVFGFQRGSPEADLSYDTRDSAAYVPKCRVIDPAFSWGDHKAPGHAWTDTVLYEAHVGGLTMLHPELGPDERGTFDGVGSSAIIEHLVKLGITSVELLPVHAFVDEFALFQRGLANYWGYNTLGFFAPHGPYLGPSQNPNRFKTMVNRLHDAGIEVILDVVFNHTAETEEIGPTLSFRGIDNASYYWLREDDPRYYVNVTGTGNSFNVRHPQVRQLVVDSLRYWTDVMGVDGFRFDLASTLIRDGDGFDTSGGFLQAVTQDPVLAKVKMIAEPWDVGPDGYKVGAFPPGWAEWNDRFRDTVRAFWRGDERIVPELAGRLLGSADLFDHAGRKAWTSVNFITAHDGFTLKDLVSYEGKHNEANGEGNRDGNDNNFSANYGVEGPTSDLTIRDVRDRQVRNMLATLLVSQGTPMLLMGDELGRTQQGNNNSYAQANALNWIDWPNVGDAGRSLQSFVAQLTELRRLRPLLRSPDFKHGTEISPGVRDVVWLRPDGGEMETENWVDPIAHSLGVRLAATGEPDLYLMMNASTTDVDFTLPVGPSWTVLLRTGEEEPGQHLSGGERLYVQNRSFVIVEAAG
ncbi:glycogen operon protein [Rhodoligotrophos appendicifer]|uniref:glycogen debranching protein GlgX n=1 Tax=Rhodoligotrophos appendicifer TaxID=987056 RepID=UPI001FE435F8|nr:glycogen debranching protein GlgX [Rhodoligotrophos appendicifer]